VNVCFSLFDGGQWSTTLRMTESRQPSEFILSNWLCVCSRRFQPFSEMTLISCLILPQCIDCLVNKKIWRRNLNVVPSTTTLSE
jgi:hypothetical protein